MDLPLAILNSLRNRNAHIYTVESCTGGALASRLTSVSGSSDVFRGGYVVYTNTEKYRMLGVDWSILNEHTAVSSQCASQMAERVYDMKKEASHDENIFVIATTGYLRDKGDETGKVFISMMHSGLSDPLVIETKMNSKINFEDMREAVVNQCLNVIYQESAK